MPAYPEYSAKLAQLKQARKDLSTALKAHNKALVTTKYHEKKALVAELKAMRGSK
jgi:hypothetical protein